MELRDARRLTGPNLQAAGPGALVEVGFGSKEERDRVVALWREGLTAIGDQLPFSLGEIRVRTFDGGAALYCAAPIDALYSATEASEWAATAAHFRLQGEAGPSLTDAIERITSTYSEERSPLLLALQEEARRRGVPFLWDDDEVSLGLGCRSRTWERDVMPAPLEVPWDELGSIPVVVVTGTNGKTTTSRILARMVKDAGQTVGSSSTDGLALNEEVIDAGDWTGPGAARAILRHRKVEVGVLETARGGILRRGLGVTHCAAALVTNIASDHLGDYGVLDLEEMARAKGLVYEIVGPQGVSVINADDPHLRGFKDQVSGTILLTSITGREAVEEHIGSGGAAVYLEENVVCRMLDGVREKLIALDDMPLARGGVARYDIENALGAVALATAIDLPLEAIQKTLTEFGTGWNDNPGRGQLTEVGGVHVMMDFGHNAHGVHGVLAVARNLVPSGSRLCVCVGQAGDRSEEDLIDLGRAVGQAAPDAVFVRDMPERYHRGRLSEETAHLIQWGLQDAGVSESRIGRVESEVAGLERALQGAQPGDLILHLVHIEREQVEGRLRELGAQV